MISKGFRLIVPLGIDCFGHKIVLVVHQGATENAAEVGEVLAELADRVLKFSHPRLYVVDGGKAIRPAILNHAGDAAFMQCCQVKNPQRRGAYSDAQKSAVKYQLRCAYKMREAADEKQALRKVAGRTAAGQSERSGQPHRGHGRNSNGTQTSYRQETASIRRQHQWHRAEFLSR